MSSRKSQRLLDRLPSALRAMPGGSPPVREVKQARIPTMTRRQDGAWPGTYCQRKKSGRGRSEPWDRPSACLRLCRHRLDGRSRPNRRLTIGGPHRSRNLHDFLRGSHRDMGSRIGRDSQNIINASQDIVDTSRPGHGPGPSRSPPVERSCHSTHSVSAISAGRAGERDESGSKAAWYETLRNLDRMPLRSDRPARS